MSANGYLPLSELTQVDGWAYLETNTAHAWNAAVAEMEALGHGTMTIASPDGAYRDFARQVYWKAYWTAQGTPSNAATPGTSNHGLGTAVDIWEVSRWPYDVLAPVMNKHGFVHDYAPEPWHWHHTSINPADNTAVASTSSTLLTPIGDDVAFTDPISKSTVPAQNTAADYLIYARQDAGTAANILDGAVPILHSSLPGQNALIDYLIYTREDVAAVKASLAELTAAVQALTPKP